MPILIMGILGLGINAISALWLYRSHSASLNIRGAMLHLLADALGSLGAVGAAGVIMLTGWTTIDPLISMVIGTMIVLGTWPLFRDAVKVLLEAAPERVEMSEVRELLGQDDLVDRLDDLHLWELNSGEFIFTATLVTHRSDCSLEELELANERLREQLHERYGIDHATFEWRGRQNALVSQRWRGCEEGC